MYLLYLDESGTPKDASQRYFVLAGLCLFERQGWWISNELDKIASRFNLDDPAEVELHGSPMWSGRGIWRLFSKIEREQAILDALHVFMNSHPSNRLFASVVNKVSVSPRDAVEVAFEQVGSRFDQYLTRLHKNHDTQRGVTIFDKSSYETPLQTLAKDFRTIGHTWGTIRNFAEVPLFLDSKASRLIQLADLVAWSIFNYYEKGEDRFWNVIKDSFDTDGKIVHGLHIIK